MREVLTLLCAAGVVVPMFQRLKVSPVLGFLLTGVLIGPYGLVQLQTDLPLLKYTGIQDVTLVRLAGEFGIMFLLFMIGLELSAERLWRLRRWVFGLGGLQVGVTGFVIGSIAAAFGNSVAASVVIGASLALSSTAVVMQILAERARVATSTGQVTFSVLLFQDLAVVPILFLVGTLGAGTDALLIGMAGAIGKALLAIGLILGVGRYMIRPLLRLVALSHSRELFLAAVLLCVIGTAAFTELAGLSHALGAFLAGLLLAETEYRHRVAVDLEPFKGLLLGVFFLSVGMGIDLSHLVDAAGWVVASVVGLVLIKAVVLFVLARVIGLQVAVAADCALLLAQGGEFAFVAVSLAVANTLIPSETAQFLLLVVGLSMAVTPLLATLGQRVGAWLTPRSEPASFPNVSPELSGHVVIVGYGRVGQLVGQFLGQESIPYVAIDSRPDRVTELRSKGEPLYQGDAAQHAFLEHLAADRAAALVVTMDDPSTAALVVAAAHKAWPHLPIYARVRDDRHAVELIEAGAAHVTLETAEAGLQLAEAILNVTGLPEDVAALKVDQVRNTIQASLGMPILRQSR